MKKASDVFKSIRFAKGETKDKPHKSTDNEEHYAVGEKEYNQQLQHVKKMAMMEETPPIKVRSLYTQTYAKHGGTASKAKEAQSKAYAEVEKKHGKQMRDSLEAFHKKNMNEAVKDKFDIGEYDQEGDMAKSDLRSILANAKRVHDMLEDGDNLPEWVQSKITKAEDYISTVANYMTAEMNEEFESLEEGRPSQRHPLEGHEYHKKTNAELEYIAKDAHKAAEAMKGHNTTAENKYRDQANDSATVRYYRQKHGMADWYKKKYGHMKEEVEQIEETKRMSAAVKLQRAFERAKEQRERSERAGKELLKPKQPTQPVQKEEVEQIDEKNEPTNPALWSRAKALARSKFDVYPSAYANGWASKWYKSKGGSWRSVSEATEPPFDKPYTTIKKVVTDKSGAKHSPMSRVRDLARLAMRKQSEKMKKPIKEEEISRKAQIVKSVIKKKKDSADSFQKDPIISKSEVKM